MPEFNLDCRKCSELDRINNGCEKDSPIPGRWHLGDIDSQRCPRRLITIETNEMITAYNMFKDGFLPNADRWPDEPAKFIEAINAIDSEVSKMHNEIMDKIKR